MNLPIKMQSQSSGRVTILIILVLLWLTPLVSYAAIEDRVLEQTENAREIQSLQIKPSGTWLPVPIPISNPTIGSGLQFALLYLHPKKDPDKSDVPNTTSGLIGMYTNTNTWLAGGFHDGNWGNDLYRYRVMMGTGEFNLDYFGIGEDSDLQDNPIAYNLSSDIIFTQLLRRVPLSVDWYVGLRYMLIDSSVVFDELFPGLPPISDNMKTSSLGLMAVYDSRDDNYFPTDGTNFELVWMRDSEKWGSDFNFNKLDAQYSYFFPLNKNSVLAFKTAMSSADDSTPFYLLPSLKMRGFANGLYKNQNSLSGHSEWRHKFKPRWGFMLSFEIGSTAASASDLFQDQTITSYGAGIRWQVTRDKKLNLGIDVGYSDGNHAIYVQVGEKF